jgi:catechol 2,3-dioxygenase-like lactoylglutathione lyase family enzyme
MTNNTSAGLENVSPEVASRYDRHDNPFELNGLDHFALPTLDIALMERFIREVLGGEPYYYAGFDETDARMGRVGHIFIRVGHVLMQCAEPANGKMIFRKDDENISPHFAFTTTPAGLDANTERLRGIGIPVAGPFRHLNVDVTSVYFQSPEGHKLEICTWEPYPHEKAGVMGAAGVGHVHWPSLAHTWPNL